MAFLNQSEYFEPSFPKVRQDPHESARMECGRLIHAAAISRRFMEMLLKNPVKSIEAGFCGEKFAFTHEEKQRIMLIQARTLADFSNQLLHVIETSACTAEASEMAFIRWEAQNGLPA